MSNVEQPIQWSYSALKTFQNCPMRYKRQYIMKDVIDPGNESTRYGTDVHLAFELCLKGEAELPEKYARFKPIIEATNLFKGDKYVEHKMALDYELKPCEFDSGKRFVRGIADLIVVDGMSARVVDWKSGNPKFADTKQLELMALMIFRHFPKVNTVKGALAFVVTDDVVKATYSKKDAKVLWRKWISDVQQIETCLATDKFLPKTSGLCRFCPVADCEFNKKES